MSPITWSIFCVAATSTGFVLLGKPWLTARLQRKTRLAVNRLRSNQMLSNRTAEKRIQDSMERLAMLPDEIPLVVAGIDTTPDQNSYFRKNETEPPIMIIAEAFPEASAEIILIALYVCIALWLHRPFSIGGFIIATGLLFAFLLYRTQSSAKTAKQVIGILAPLC